MLAWHPEWSRRHDLFTDPSHHNEAITAWEGSVLRDARAHEAWMLHVDQVDGYVKRVLRESLP